jgi:hypothetical protein
MGQLQLCGGRVGYEDRDGYLAAISEPLVFGQCLHHILGEDVLSGNLQQDKLLQSMSEWVDQILVEHYDWTLKQVPNIPEFFSELSTAYRLWRTTVLPNLPGELILAEEELFLPLGAGREQQVVLKGTPDAVYTEALVDWKTAGRGWKQVKADVSVQASLYPALVKQNYQKSIRDFHFWVFGRQKGSWSRLKTSRKIEQINGALVTAHNYGKQLEAQVFPCTPVPESSFNKKRGWYCSPKFCGAWNVCEAKYMNDNVDESVVAERKWK